VVVDVCVRGIARAHGSPVEVIMRREVSVRLDDVEGLVQADAPPPATARAKMARASFERIAKEERPRVERLLRKMLGDRCDIDDLAQCVFLESLRSLDRFRGEATLSSFITGVTVRIARRARRSTAWERRRTDLLTEPAARRPDASSALILKEQLERTAAVLERIAAPKREAFLLWALDGLTVDAIAARTRTSIPATRSRIFHARKELRARAERDDCLLELC
jgi:RNA polymerase sigma-70 factor (ECF subfamily)